MTEAQQRVLHPSAHAATDPDRLAVVQPGRRASRTYRELDEASNRIAHLLRRRGLVTGDHVAVLTTNTIEWFEVVWGAMRAGLYVTPVNWHLTADEAGYIIEDCGASAVFASAELADIGDRSACARFTVDDLAPGWEHLPTLVADLPATPIDDEADGMWMFYSSGTTGRPKGIKPDLPAGPVGAPTGFTMLLEGLYGFDATTRYLSPAPLYHAAPAGWSVACQQIGGTVMIMERFDPGETLELLASERITHAQFVPTHLIRMLKLPDETRAAADTSSLRYLVHAAAPCPADTKRAVIDWFGPVVHEYYAGSEGTGFFAIDSHEWLAHPGSVGRSLLGPVHILDDDHREVPVGTEGQVWFESPRRFEYHGDPEKTASVFDEAGWSTIGDVGRIDEEGYLYLTDRASNMIISGGVNIYPREIEDLLAVHPSVDDVAVIGTPHDDFGEQVTAFVQPAAGVDAGPALATELIERCRSRLAGYKCPREVRFVDELPRLPNGKLLKRRLS